jgi:hypothetical protein
MTAVLMILLRATRLTTIDPAAGYINHINKKNLQIKYRKVRSTKTNLYDASSDGERKK